jgi:hypothetical protein
MKRTNLVLDEQLLERATKLAGAKPIRQPYRWRSKSSCVAFRRARFSNSRAAVCGWAIYRKCAAIPRGLPAGDAASDLIDTSIWIEVFRRPSKFRIEEHLSLDEVVTCLPVIQEVLQGFVDERVSARLRGDVCFPGLGNAILSSRD